MNIDFKGMTMVVARVGAGAYIAIGIVDELEQTATLRLSVDDARELAYRLLAECTKASL